MELTQTVPSLKNDAKRHPVSAIENIRVNAIDILRAITMLLMIFVNDLWSLTDIPEWLEHVPGNADGMGLADSVFPAFLFIVGMSIPYAIENRRQRESETGPLLAHIAGRSIALLVMGVMLVNGENLNASATGISRSIWNTVACISFIFIWNAYPGNFSLAVKRILQGVGIGALLTLAFIYCGGEGENVNHFATYWWGILGLIGWCYLTASVITVIARNRFVPVLGAWIFFSCLSIISSAKLIPRDSVVHLIPSPIVGGTLVALTLGGVLTSLIFKHFTKKQLQTKLFITLFVIAAVLLILGFVTNIFWDISKIRATAPWLFLCSSFTILAFIVIYWLSDLKRKSQWFSIIKPGGTDTLLCYLIPYFAYAIVRASGLHLPSVLLTGTIGLIKSFAFALLCILTAGVLAKKGIRLKL